MPQKFFTESEQKVIVEAIRLAETDTSGEIRVHIDSSVEGEEVVKHAAKIFDKLGMEKTKLRERALAEIQYLKRDLGWTEIPDWAYKKWLDFTLNS